MRRTYNLTEAQYLIILAAQGGACAVCLELPPEGKWLPVDHDHVSGLVRGLLCAYCNLRIVGRHRAGVKLRRAADYLESPPAERFGVYAPTAAERRKVRAKRARSRSTRTKSKPTKAKARSK